MNRVEALKKMQELINGRSRPVATDVVLVGFLEQIAGSLAVIADVLAEQKGGEDDERTD